MHVQPYFWGILLLAGVQTAMAETPIETRSIPTTKSASQGVSLSLSDDLLNQIAALQKEVEDLRGTVEIQEHELKRVEKSQQTLFLNLEKQLAEHHPGSAKKVVAHYKTEPTVQKQSPLQTQPTAQTEPAAPPESQTEQSMIKAAEALLKQKQYDDAEKHYQEYLSLYPNGQFAPTVHYTLGEIYWTEWHQEKTNTLYLEKAVHAFSDVANGFPDHAKARDALLKIGLAEIEKGNYQTAAQYFKKVIERYPKTPSAKIAELRLQKLTQEGHIS